MARPLAKYKRPATVEEVIDRALGQDLDTLRARARIRDAKSPDHLPSECLVHLIRKAHRENNQRVRDGLLVLLLERCAANFSKNIVNYIPNAAQVRQQILNDFGALFALEDESQDEHRALDFYECKFNLALHSFRITRLRQILKSQNEFVPLPAKMEISEDYEEGDDLGTAGIDESRTLNQAHAAADAELAMAEVGDDFNPDQDAEVRALFSILRSEVAAEDDDFRVRVFRAIMELPREEAKALLLVHYRGLTEEAAARRCGVTDRTIRNRMSRAKAKLLRLKEDT